MTEEEHARSVMMGLISCAQTDQIQRTNKEWNGELTHLIPAARVTSSKEPVSDVESARTFKQVTLFLVMVHFLQANGMI